MTPSRTVCLMTCILTKGDSTCWSRENRMGQSRPLNFWKRSVGLKYGRPLSSGRKLMTESSNRYLDRSRSWIVYKILIN